MSAPTLRREVRLVPLSQLNAAPYNPRRISPAAMTGLERSIERFGMVELIVWNERTGNVVGGHQRLKALQARREEAAEVIVVNLDAADEKALNVALNSGTIRGEFTDELQALLEEIAGSRQAIFDELMLGDLRGEIAVVRERGELNTAPDVPKEPITQPGDIWTLGRHRLVCGDACLAETYVDAVGTELADMLLTDPPYGVDVNAKMAHLDKQDGGRRTRSGKIQGDTKKGYREWYALWLALIPWAERATLYVFSGEAEAHSLRLAIEDVGYAWSSWLVWVKNRQVLARKDYHSRHEFILYGWPKRHRFYGGRTRANVLEFDAPIRSDQHPTMKPVELLEQLVTDGSPRGGLVLDPFAGSGSSLIACEQVDRRCVAIEIEPGYCDVIVERWQQVTGKTAHRQR